MEIILKNLHKLLSEKHNFKPTRLLRTLKEIQIYDHILKNPTINESLPLLERLCYFLNINLKYHVQVRLKYSKSLLEDWINSAIHSSISIPDLLSKLLIITNLNLSFFYQSSSSPKSLKYALESLKLCEKSKLRSNRGRLLNFICRLRLSELYIASEKYQIAISCCETVLKQVKSRLLLKTSKKSRTIQELAMTSITALFRIAMCKKILGFESQETFNFAESIGKEYLGKNSILEELIYEKKLFENLPKKTGKKGKNFKENSKKLENFQVNEKVFQMSSKEIPMTQKVSELKMSRSQEISPSNYYSSEKLKKLKKILESQESEKIFTTDEFFFRKMTKKLGIQIKNEKKEQFDSSCFDRQRLEIHKLRDRRSFKLMPTSLSPKKIEEKIEWFNKICENNLKLQEIKMKSSLKTKVYKGILKSINFSYRNMKKTPNQRLIFSPPSNNRQSPSQTHRAVLQRRLTLVKRKAKEFNLEIEDQIGTLNEEFDSNNRFWKTRTGSNRNVGGLVKSVLTSKLKPSQIQKSIYSAFNNK